jgi:protein TonB
VGRIPAVSGVLETFSALPDAFCDTHLALLEELAELVIAAQRRSVESFARTASQEAAIAPRQSWAKRGLVLATAAGLALLGWVSLRGKLDGSHFSAAPQPTTIAVVANRSVDAVPAVVSKPDVSPPVLVRETKSGLPTGVVIATKSEKTAPEEDVIIRKFGPDSDSKPTAVRVPASLSTAAPHIADSPASAAPPALRAVSTSVDTALSRLLSVPHNVPQVAPRVSQGISGGTIERRVIPVYPRQGLERRLEGRVLLQAVVTEDGTLRDLKVLNGDPLLARAAVEAVAQWRYRPYRLNGTPISTQTKIAVVFKLP